VTAGDAAEFGFFIFRKEKTIHRMGRHPFRVIDTSGARGDGIRRSAAVSALHARLEQDPRRVAD
jgi:hypothetical protein